MECSSKDWSEAAGIMRGEPSVCSLGTSNHWFLIFKGRRSTFFSTLWRNCASMPSTESVSHYDLIVCACESQEYTARDAIEAAIFRGELEGKWKKFLHHVAAENRE